jgi:hypothetical protein
MAFTCRRSTPRVSFFQRSGPDSGQYGGDAYRLAIEDLDDLLWTSVADAMAQGQND